MKLEGGGGAENDNFPPLHIIVEAKNTTSNIGFLTAGSGTSPKMDYVNARKEAQTYVKGVINKTSEKKYPEKYRQKLFADKKLWGGEGGSGFPQVMNYVFLYIPYDHMLLGEFSQITSIYHANSICKFINLAVLKVVPLTATRRQ